MRPDPDEPFDREFRAALRYFLQQRDWTYQEFCDRTRLSPQSQRRIVPSSVSDWCKRSHPSNRAIMIVCEALGVTRSYFFEAGERIVATERTIQEKEAALQENKPTLQEKESGAEEEIAGPESGPRRDGKLVSLPAQAGAVVSG